MVMAFWYLPIASLARGREEGARWLTQRAIHDAERSGSAVSPEFFSRSASLLLLLPVDFDQPRSFAMRYSRIGFVRRALEYRGLAIPRTRVTRELVCELEKYFSIRVHFKSFAKLISFLDRLFRNCTIPPYYIYS